MIWEVKYLPEAEKDLHSLSHSQQVMVIKAIKKVKLNPLPQSEGGDMVNHLDTNMGQILQDT